MTNSEYEKIIREGSKVDWYGEMVPEGLINTKVKFWANGLVAELHLLEGELSELKGVSLDKRKNYIKSAWNNVRHAPYTINGDTYLIKKKRIEESITKEVKKPTKKRKTTKKKTTTTSKTTSKDGKTTATKNGSLIFGKK